MADSLQTDASSLDEYEQINEDHTDSISTMASRRYEQLILPQKKSYKIQKEFYPMIIFWNAVLLILLAASFIYFVATITQLKNSHISTMDKRINSEAEIIIHKIFDKQLKYMSDYSESLKQDLADLNETMNKNMTRIHQRDLPESLHPLEAAVEKLQMSLNITDMHINRILTNDILNFHEPLEEELAFLRSLLMSLMNLTLGKIYYCIIENHIMLAA